MTRRVLRLTAALVAAVFLWVTFTLPPRPAVATGAVSDEVRARTIAGAMHVHSSRSDGSGDREAIAAAAARAGLQFVVVTDHGDATRQPDPPAYLHGVLCVDAVEVSTNGGHVLALGMRASPYPLGGEADDVVEDIVRFGGFPVAAHPDSPKIELAWKDWSTPIAGLEWLNLDSAWRAEPAGSLLRVAFDALVRPGPALASIFDRPVQSLARWDSMSAGRRVVGLAGHDAHGGVRSSEGGREWAAPGASYGASFAAFSNRVVLDAALTGSAEADAAALLAAMRAGRVFTAIDGLAGPALVDFHVRSASSGARMGDERLFEKDSTLTVQSTAAPGTLAVLLRDGAEVASASGGSLSFRPSEPGAYRVELRRPGARVPWVVTNPIYLRGAGTGGAGESVVGKEPVTRLELPDAGAIEKDPASSATLTVDAGRRFFSFALRPGERVSQYAALAIPLPRDLPAFDSIAFDGRSDKPLRLSVQLRFESAGGARWRRSVYLSTVPDRVVVPVSRMVGADRPGPLPPASSATSLLFVVDLVNAHPGFQGLFEVSNLRLLRN